MTTPRDADPRACAPDVTGAGLDIDRAQPHPGSASVTPIISAGMCAQPSGADVPARVPSPNVRVLGRDGEPAIGCEFQVMIERETIMSNGATWILPTAYGDPVRTNEDGRIEVPIIPCVLKNASCWFEVTGPEAYAEGLVPLDIRILKPIGDELPVPARAGPDPIPSHVPWGASKLSFDIDLPDDVARPDRAVRENFIVSRYAEHARLAIPTWPATTVRLTVHDEDGKPVRGAKVTSLELGGRDVVARYEPSDAAGAITIRGVPLLRHEQLEIDVNGDETFGSVSFPIGREVHARVELQSNDFMITIGGGSGSWRRGCGGRRRIVRAASYVPATLVLGVHRSNGRPARGAFVQLSKKTLRADRDGQVRFEGLRPGRHSLWVREPGFVTLHRNVVLKDGEIKYLTLHEPPGVTKTVRVEDHEGAPVPFARVTVEGGATYTRIVRGVQDLALFTDHYGEIELPRLSRGNDRVRAVIGSRRKRIKMQNGSAAVVGLPKPRGMR